MHSNENALANEAGHDPERDEDNIPLPPDDEAPLEEDMSDVDAADSVVSEHPDN
ncbi:hypothetical protein H0Z09_12975 [Pseudomonas sp. SWRI18]|uniref:hypothetical protein n=1 Tax=Pseudomonas sp. SWRI18 TaxID=2753888 RepID=UPI0016491D7F|nr:hypothetical protein [Pseudomonas sp. SWRI18]MBC3302039.1 hypothetical protein [Pseudomonas sp. SWRI18]